MKPSKKSFILEVDSVYGSHFLDKDWLFFWDAPGAVEFLRKDNKNRLILKWQIGDETYFVKKFFQLYPKDRFGPFNEWRQIYNLRKIGLNTPDPVAFGCDLPEKRGFIVTRKASGYSLETWATEYECGNFDDVVPVCALVAGRLHQSGFTHQDFYFSHLFWDEKTRSITLIDLQRVRYFRKGFLNLLAIIKDIAQIFYSASFFLDNLLYARFKEIFWREYSHYVPQHSGRFIRFLVGLKVRKIAMHDRKIRNRLKS